MSGLRGQGTQDLMEACFRVFDRWRRRVPTPVLNRFVRALQQVPDRCPNGFKVTFITQVSARPPTFAAFAPTRGLHDHMQRFLVRALREEFDMLGVPVRLVVRDKTTPGDVRKKKVMSGGDSSKKHRAAHRRRRVGKALQKK